MGRFLQISRSRPQLFAVHPLCSALGPQAEKGRKLKPSAVLELLGLHRLPPKTCKKPAETG